MSDLNPAPSAPAAAPAVSAPANENVVANPAPIEGQTEGAQTPPEPPQPKGPSRLQKRIDELTAQRYEEQRRADDAHARLAAFERKQALTQQFSELDAKAPRVDQFQDLQSYQMAVSDWTTQRAAAIAAAQWDERMQQFTAQQTQQQQRVMAEQHKVMRDNVRLEERMSAGVKKYPDFHAVVGNPELPSVRGSPLFDAVLESDNAVDIAYSLAKNPAELERLLGITDPIRISREVFRLDSKFTGNGATQAPPPPPQRNGASAAPKDYGQMSTAEHVKAYLGAKAKRR